MNNEEKSNAIELEISLIESNSTYQEYVKVKNLMVIGRQIEDRLRTKLIQQQQIIKLIKQEDQIKQQMPIQQQMVQQQQQQPNVIPTKQPLPAGTKIHNVYAKPQTQPEPITQREEPEPEDEEEQESIEEINKEIGIGEDIPIDLSDLEGDDNG